MAIVLIYTSGVSFVTVSYSMVPTSDQNSSSWYPVLLVAESRASLPCLSSKDYSTHFPPNTLCIHSTRSSAIIVCRQLKLHSTMTVYSQHKPRPIVPTTSTPISPQTPQTPRKQWELSQTHPPAVLPLFLLSQSLLQLLSFCLRIIVLKTQMTNTVNVSYALASFSSFSPLSKQG